MHPFYNEPLSPTAPTHSSMILARFSPLPVLVTLGLETRVAISP